MGFIWANNHTLYEIPFDFLIPQQFGYHRIHPNVHINNFIEAALHEYGDDPNKLANQLPQLRSFHPFVTFLGFQAHIKYQKFVLRRVSQHFLDGSGSHFGIIDPIASEELAVGGIGEQLRVSG
jgi:hypothetical protein